MKRGWRRQFWQSFGVMSVLLVGIFGAIVVLEKYELARAVEPTIVLSNLASEDVAPQLAWPQYGQAAIATEKQGIIATHGSQMPYPTASTAKVITVLAVLEKKPLKLGEQGPTLTLTEVDVQLHSNYIAKNGSNTPVYAGLKLTQYQALQSIMLASSNNIADTLAIWAFGSIDAYHTYANDMVKRLGAKHTTIGGDASGLSPTTTSTAEDMARISLEALKHPVIANIASQSTADIPYAGIITNTNRLLREHSEIIGLKTGETVEAGGNFLLGAQHTDGGETQHVAIVVYGAELVGNAMADSYALYRSAVPYIVYREIVPAGTVVARYELLRNTSARAITKQSVMSWVWAGNEYARPAVTATSVTSETSDCTEVGSFAYEHVSVPLVLSRADNTTCVEVQN